MTGRSALYQLHIHFVGIGGTGLSAMALVSLELGAEVSGSDRADSPVVGRLREQGARVSLGHHEDNIAGANLVVISSAIPPGNPEIEAAHAAGIPVLTRADFVGRLLQGRYGIGVAGTHGKTTTTAMIAWALAKAGLNPGFIIGATARNLGTNARAGKGREFVIEADEYRLMFWGLHPDLAVITTIEMDHPDCFPTIEDMMAAFRGFVGRVPRGGSIVGNADDPRVRDVLADAADRRLMWYGRSEDADWRATDLRRNQRGGFSFTVRRRDDRWGEIALQVPGAHNVMNALAAAAAATLAGAPPEAIREALEEFEGSERRFEHKGTAGGVDVYDDYAHHPTEVRATLEGARARFPDRRIWAVFQPHTYSRLKALLPEFAHSFDVADGVIVTDVFAARECDDLGVSSSDLLRVVEHPNARHIADLDAAARYLESVLQPGDVLITLGAGDGYRVGEVVLRQRVEIDRG